MAFTISIPRRSPRCAFSCIYKTTPTCIPNQDDIEHQKKADHIVATVLEHIDTDHDEKISPEELETAGLDGLPNFDDLGAEGHHYDVESGMSISFIY